MEKPNHSRYDDFDLESYHRKGVVHFILRDPGDAVVLPILHTIKNKILLEVGIGSGYYLKQYYETNNEVAGADINPQIGAHLPLTITRASATDFSQHYDPNSFDVITSFWMTEYLAPNDLALFIKQALITLKDGGELITSIIDSRGWGKFYTSGAALKGINKYGYAKKEIVMLCESIGVSSFELINVRGRLGLPFAYILRLKK